MIKEPITILWSTVDAGSGDRKRGDTHEGQDLLAGLDPEGRLEEKGRYN